MLFWIKRCAAFDPDFSFYETFDPGFAYALMLFFVSFGSVSCVSINW